MIPVLLRRARPDGVTVYLAERLGNQLFMYAAGLAQARRLDVPLYFNLGFLRSRRPPRDYPKINTLTGFDHGAVIPDDPRAHVSPLLAGEGLSWVHAGHNLLARIPGERTGRRVFAERTFGYDPLIEGITPGTTLLGFFQSWRYFDAIAEELAERIGTLHQPSAWYREMAARIRPGDGAIALNVRRGDYVTEQQQRIQGLATRAYYERGLEHLRRLGLDGPVYVASDSLTDVMTEFAGLGGPGGLVPIDPPPGTDPLEALLVLSRTSGLVAANSTFSWWAGYLGGRHGIEVIAPRPWFTQTDLDTRDLLPTGWLTLDRAP